MRTHTFISGTLSLLLVGIVSAAEPDWPQWRGPKRDGVSTETGLLKEWPKEGPPLLWKATGLGSGYSSVSIAGERVFTIGNQRGKSQLIALSRKDGSKLWTAEVGREGGHLGSTPTVDGERVYAIGQEGDLVCVDVDKGEVKWRKNFKKDFGGSYGDWHYTESPLVDGERLICTPGGKDAIMVALDRKTGEVIWKTPSPFRSATAGYSSIVITEVGGIKMYVQLAAGGVLGVDAKDGKVLWTSDDRLAGTTANVPTPIVLPNNQLFVCAGYDRGGALLTLSVKDGEVKVKEEYYKGHLKNKHGGVIIVGERIYGDRDDSGSLFCADVKTGELVWKKGERSKGSGSAAVTYADGHLYVYYDNGFVALVDARGEKYQEAAGFKVPSPRGPCWAHPVVAGGKLYLRQDDTLYCHDLKPR